MRRHAGDQAWSDARLIRLSETIAGHEDAIDRVREVLEELRAEDLDATEINLADVIERLEAAVHDA